MSRRVLPDVGEAARETVAEELLDGGRERGIAQRALRSHDERAASSRAAQLAVEVFAQAALAPVDRLWIRVMESRHGFLACDLQRIGEEGTTAAAPDLSP